MSLYPTPVHAACPLCGRANVVGTFPEDGTGEPPAMMEKCAHFVFVGFTKSLGLEYARNEFGIEAEGSLGLEAELMKVLNSRFTFAGPIAFVPSKQARNEARKAVEDFLRSRKFLG